LRPHGPTPPRSVRSHAPRGVYAPHIVCEARTVHIRPGPRSTLTPHLVVPARYAPPESPLNAARLSAGGLGRGRAATLRRGFRAAFTGANRSKNVYSRGEKTRTARPLPTAYLWHLTHAAWNLLRRIETGNTPRAPRDARALRFGNRVAIWWEEPPASSAVSGWYTAKVFDPIVEHSTQHIFK